MNFLIEQKTKADKQKSIAEICRETSLRVKQRFSAEAKNFAKHNYEKFFDKILSIVYDYTKLGDLYCQIPFNDIFHIQDNNLSLAQKECLDLVIEKLVTCKFKVSVNDCVSISWE